jgi:hypothetical protein
MSAADWKQWAMDRPNWIQRTIQSGFEKFVEQECKDALNVAAGEPSGLGVIQSRAEKDDAASQEGK